MKTDSHVYKKCTLLTYTCAIENKVTFAKHVEIQIMFNFRSVTYTIFFEDYDDFLLQLNSY